MIRLSYKAQLKYDVVWVLSLEIEYQTQEAKEKRHDQNETKAIIYIQ